MDDAEPDNSKGNQVSGQAHDDVVRYTEIVDVSPDDAFRAFVEQFSEWWPAIYTFAADDLQYIGMEQEAGGRCIERDHAGNELIWGEVLVYQPPARIVFSWWIHPDRTVVTDPDRASEIDVRFIDERALTRVEFEHRHLSRHGEGWETMRDAMAAREGWPFLLQRYSDFANR
jgi:uncharacterized protein YndB with AHSA1/START domain